MKTVKVFLASSEELKEDRNRFGNFIRKLSDKYEEEKDVRIKLFEWEDYDAAYNGMKKQEEYNAKIKDCDIFVALFQSIVGKYTMEEVKYAYEEFVNNSTPKIGVFIKFMETQEKENDHITSLKEYLSSLNLEWNYYKDFKELSGMVKKLLPF
jgi:hypothetical protein